MYMKKNIFLANPHALRLMTVSVMFKRIWQMLGHKRSAPNAEAVMCERPKAVHSLSLAKSLCGSVSSL